MAREYRFFTSDIGVAELGGADLEFSAVKEPEIFNQLVKVLRVKPDDVIVLLCGSNVFGEANYDEFVYVVTSAHKKGVGMRFLESRVNDNELGREIELILCLPNKPEKLSFIIQKAVELGVNSITLVNGDYSSMKHGLREDRLMKIMKEAAEQSERGFVPLLKVGGGLANLLEGRVKDGRKPLVALEKMTKPKYLDDVLKDNLKSDISILVGPEGGFSEEEKNLFIKKKLPCFSLGKRVLRMETAVILALGIVGLKG